jgi:hypothetical protein
MSPLSNPSPDEDWEQAKFFSSLIPMMIDTPEFGLVFAVPNGGKRAIKTAVRLKRTGVKPGVPDVHFPVPRGPYVGWWGEMKRRPYRDAKGRLKRSYPTAEQKAWHAALRVQGHRVDVCEGYKAALANLMSYWEMGDSRWRTTLNSLQS